MLVLGIETSCDDTSCAIVENGVRILSNVINTQAEHEETKGVIPEIAARSHEKTILFTLRSALSIANKTIQDIDKIAVTYGPGLVPSLQTGLLFAKGLAISLDKPLSLINHLTAHVFAAIMTYNQPILFPVLGLVLSGGHTIMLLLHSWDNVEVIGSTIDDALGEAFDKVAIMLGLNYPGGPHIERLAQNGNRHAISFSKFYDNPQRPFDTSFSGIKTQMKHKIETDLVSQEDMAASFQYAVFKYIADKIQRAVDRFGISQILCGGGVFNNICIRNTLIEYVNAEMIFPERLLSTDNAAMIAGLGYYIKNDIAFYNKHVEPNLLWGSN